MTWRLAKGLEILRKQVNEMYPTRSKASDGTRGDSAHAARKSDHNEDSRGIVHALDLTHDPRVGFDSYRFADLLLQGQDSRISYIISNGRIGSGPSGTQPGKWRRYIGANPHDHHVHISITKASEDDTRPWDIGARGVPLPKAKPAPMVLRNGSVGVMVQQLQRKLGIPADAIFGRVTESAVKAFQKSNRLPVDGIVGPQTWKVING